MAAAGCLIEEYWKEVTCPICLEYFTDPVMTDCGHNFCRACLTQFRRSLGRNISCPECRLTIQPSSLRPNRKLASIVEITKKFNLQEEKGDESAGGVCQEHQEPLKLFCRDDEAPISMICDRSKEHQEHQVILEEAAEEHKETNWVQLQSLKEGREKFERKVVEEQRSQECLETNWALLQSLKEGREKFEREVAETKWSQECRKQLEEEKQKEKRRKFLEKEEYTYLKFLADREEKMKKLRGKTRNRFCDNICFKDVEGRYQQPPSEFLQEFRGTMSWRQDGVQSRRQVQSELFEWNLPSALLKTSVLQNAKDWLEDADQDMSFPEDHHTEENWTQYIINVIVAAKPLITGVFVFALYVFLNKFL